MNKFLYVIAGVWIAYFVLKMFSIPPNPDLINIQNNEYTLYDYEKKTLNATLIFVTPWSKKGYEYALKYHQKIDFVSPVWFIMNNQVSGQHDINEEWLMSMQATNVKIIPRLYIEGQPHEILTYLQPSLIEDILQLYDRFEGIILDSPVLSYIEHLKFTQLMDFVTTLSKRFRDKKKYFFTTFAGVNENIKYQKKTFRQLAKLSDYVLIQTYDYQDQDKQYQQLCPIAWFNQNLEMFQSHENVLFGLPFYGFKRSGSQISHIVANDFMAMNNYISTWDAGAKECVYEKQHYITYPCPDFIKERIRLLNLERRGVFIWEGGQGLQQLYNLI